MTQPERARRRFLPPIRLVLMVLFALWLGLRKRDEPRRRVATNPPAADTVPARPGAGTGPFDPSRMPPATDNEPAPVVDSVTVEKQEVCEGEENLVTVKAHTVNGTDAFLHYTIVGDTGIQVPIRIFEAGREKRGEFRNVIVFGRNNVPTTAQIPAFQVKKCQPYRTLSIQYRVNPNTAGEFDMWAKVVDVGAKRDQRATPFVPASFAWILGDGTTETTKAPAVTHSYEARSQDTLYSQFLITVTAVGVGGEKVVGRTSLQLLNPVFEELSQKGTLRLLTTMNPRFPEMTEERNVVQGVRLFHTRADPVAITKITVLKHFHPRQESTPETVTEDVDVVKTLGQRDVPPGPGIEFSVSEPAPSKGPHWISFEYFVEGQTVEGWKALGSFALMHPPARPTKERGTPVTDPQQIAKILKARELLGKEFVTDEEIWRLEREGRLTNLTLDPRAARPAPASQPRPQQPEPEEAPK